MDRKNQKIYDVVIIGAGMAGLICAEQMKKMGYSVLIVEGSNRIGGRIYDVDFAGTEVPMGAAWLHNLDCPELLERFKGGFFPDTQEIRIFPKRIITRSQLSGRLKSIYDNPLSLTAKDRAISENGDRSFLGDYNLFGPSDSGRHPKQASLKETSNINSQAGLIPLQGFSEILAAFSKPNKYDIKLNKVVERVHSLSRDCQHVYVTGAEQPYAAKRVVVTTSIGVLKAGKIKFSKLSDGSKKKFTPKTMKKLFKGNKITMGCFEKIHFSIGGYNQLLVDNGLNNDFHGHIYGEEAPMLFKTHTHEPIITCYLGADIAKSLLKEGQNSSEMAGFAHHLLRKYLKGSFDILGARASNWMNDPLFLGSYSAAKVGGYNKRDVTEENQADLAKYGICFAGEAIPAKDLPQATQVPGAFISGEFAANLLIKSLGLSRSMMFGRK